MGQKCSRCKGELRMKITIHEKTDKGNITFINVPVTGCYHCGDEGYSMRDGLIIEHYAKFHAHNNEIVDFEEIYPSYEKLSMMDIMRLSRTALQ